MSFENSFRTRLGDIVTLSKVKVGSRTPPILSMTRRHGLVAQESKFDKRVASVNLAGYKYVERGQLVYGFPIDEGVVAVLHRFDEGAVSPIYNVWDVNQERVDGRYFDWLLRTPAVVNEYRRRMSVTVDRRRLLAPADFGDIEVLLPPIDEQRAIAGVLMTVQRAKEATEKVIAATKELRRSLMRHLFTYGPVSIHAASSVPLKSSEIGEIPKHWDLRPLGDLIEIASGQVDPKAAPYSNMPCMGPEDIVSGEGEHGPLPTAREAGVISGKYLFNPGDIIYSKIRPYLRKCVRVNVQGLCSADMYPLRPAGLNRDYLFHFLLSEDFTTRVTANQLRARIPKINRGELGAVLTPLPPHPEQVLMASTLDVLRVKVQRESRRSAALDDLFKSLLHNLMTGQLRVSLLDFENQNATEEA